MNTRNITRLEFVNAPGVSRPTSTKVYLDRSARLTPEMLKYVGECRERILLVYLGLFDYLDKIHPEGARQDSNEAYWIVNGIDHHKFFNGDKSLEGLISMSESVYRSEALKIDRYLNNALGALGLNEGATVLEMRVTGKLTEKMRKTDIGNDVARHIKMMTGAPPRPELRYIFISSINGKTGTGMYKTTPNIDGHTVVFLPHGIDDCALGADCLMVWLNPQTPEAEFNLEVNRRFCQKQKHKK